MCMTRTTKSSTPSSSLDRGADVSERHGHVSSRSSATWTFEAAMFAFSRSLSNKTISGCILASTKNRSAGLLTSTLSYGHLDP
jgi:hypothetical protein